VRAQLKPREATYLPFADADGSPIDHGLALHFVAPHSFTGEDVLELQAHGGPVVLQLLVARCLQAAAEPTRPQASRVWPVCAWRNPASFLNALS
jgi:tRNA U34 5-carboxymethylaminomethyl modifying GTPase MnmE/TrmE